MPTYVGLTLIVPSRCSTNSAFWRRNQVSKSNAVSIVGAGVAFRRERGKGDTGNQKVTIAFIYAPARFCALAV